MTDAERIPSPPMICSECIATKRPMVHVTGIAFLHCEHHQTVAAWNPRLQCWTAWSPVSDEAYLEGTLQATIAWSGATSTKA